MHDGDHLGVHSPRYRAGRLRVEKEKRRGSSPRIRPNRGSSVTVRGSFMRPICLNVHQSFRFFFLSIRPTNPINDQKRVDFSVKAARLFLY